MEGAGQAAGSGATPEAAELVAQLAVRCLLQQWEARPPISEVVANLEKALELARCDG